MASESWNPSLRSEDWKSGSGAQGRRSIGGDKGKGKGNKGKNRSSSTPNDRGREFGYSDKSKRDSSGTRGNRAGKRHGTDSKLTKKSEEANFNWKDDEQFPDPLAALTVRAPQKHKGLCLPRAQTPTRLGDSTNNGNETGFSSNVERFQAEEAARLEASRLAQAEKERKALEKKERLQAEQEEAERKASEEAAKFERERLAQEEAARLEAARIEADRLAQEEADRKAKEEKARVEAERLEKEAAERLEAERLAEVERKAVEEKARVEAERLEKEEAERLEAERLAEVERKAAEEKAKIDAERLKKEEDDRVEAERLAQAEAKRKAEEAASEAARLKEVADREAVEEEARRLAQEEAERKELGKEEAARLKAERVAKAEAQRKADRVSCVQKQKSRANAYVDRVICINEVKRINLCRTAPQILLQDGQEAEPGFITTEYLSKVSLVHPLRWENAEVDFADFHEFSPSAFARLGSAYRHFIEGSPWSADERGAFKDGLSLNGADFSTFREVAEKAVQDGNLDQALCSILETLLARQQERIEGDGVR